MRKAREPAKNEFQEQVDEASSQDAQPMAITRDPKRAVGDDAEQGSAQGQQTALVRTRSGAHHHHRREPAAETVSVQDGAEVKTEDSPGATEIAANGAGSACEPGEQ